MNRTFAGLVVVPPWWKAAARAYPDRYRLAEGARTMDRTDVGSSVLATLQHSRRVDELLLQMVRDVQDRMTRHDLSKMEEPELSVFDEYTPKLRDSTYGSEEYKGFLAEMKVALDHHYASNRHHPEHFEDGVDGMTLVDLMEMLADWKAATERHADGSLSDSLRIQKERFDLSPQLVSVLANTALELGWLDENRLRP
jgi:hypothetical protein